MQLNPRDPVATPIVGRMDELFAVDAEGRKTWIHIGSPQAGPKVAAILSVVESCGRLKGPVRDYLTAVLPDSPILDPAPPRA